MSKKEALLIGGSGFIGNALGEALARKGYGLRLLTRSASKPFLAFPYKHFQWDGKTIPTLAMEGTGTVVNLAGQSIAGKRWSPRYKEKILNSRVQTSEALVKAFNSSKEKPELIIQASAMGYYGLDNRHEVCHEQSIPGQDFLGEVCQKWETALDPLKKEARVCFPRLGLVLGWGRGAFPKLWDLYTNGLGAVLGSGQQWMNWVHIDDVVNFFVEAIEKDHYKGAYNLVAPGNKKQVDFHKELSKRSNSFAFMKTPELALKVLLGDGAYLLTRGTLLEPRHLNQAGFEFKYSELDVALDQILQYGRYDYRAYYHSAKIWLPTTLEKVWEFSSSAYNLEKITPPWLKFKVNYLSTDAIEKDTIIKYSLRLKGLPFSWTTKITQWKPQRLFADNQESGPYKLWFHQHHFSELAGGVLVEDRVDYRLPLFPLSLPAFPIIKSDVNKIFSYRAKAMCDIFS